MASELSELFLDTEVRWWIPRIAHTSLELNYDDEELDALFRYGVTPELWLNLILVAGEWAGFEEEALADAVAKNLKASRLRKWFWDRVYRARAPVSDFDAVMRFRDVLASEPESARSAVVLVLTDLAHLYFETMFEAEAKARIRQAGLSAEKIGELSEAIIEQLGPLCYHHEKHTKAERDARLRADADSLSAAAR